MIGLKQWNFIVRTFRPPGQAIKYILGTGLKPFSKHEVGSFERSLAIALGILTGTGSAAMGARELSIALGLNSGQSPMESKASWGMAGLGGLFTLAMFRARRKPELAQSLLMRLMGNLSLGRLARESRGFKTCMGGTLIGYPFAMHFKHIAQGREESYDTPLYRWLGRIFLGSSHSIWATGDHKRTILLEPYVRIFNPVRA